jgi:predicted NUDIX family phosphoesterase
MSIVATEHVLVVPTPVFHRLGHFQGFCGDTDRYLRGLLDPAHTCYRPRNEMEQDPSFKQLIPYVLFRWRDPAGRTQLFQYTRGKGQGEARLHAKRSVGIGGHISADDAGCESAYEEGMRRELVEEVVIETPYKSQLAGLINDDETDVGRVHLGVVHLFDVERPNVRSAEDDICEAGFRPVEELLADMSKFETWSQICLQALFPGKFSLSE